MTNSDGRVGAMSTNAIKASGDESQSVVRSRFRSDMDSRFSNVVIRGSLATVWWGGFRSENLAISPVNWMNHLASHGRLSNHERPKIPDNQHATSNS